MHEETMDEQILAVLYCDDLNELPIGYAHREYRDEYTVDEDRQLLPEITRRSARSFFQRGENFPPPEGRPARNEDPWRSYFEGVRRKHREAQQKVGK